MTLILPHWELPQFVCSMSNSSSWHPLITPWFYGFVIHYSELWEATAFRSENRGEEDVWNVWSAIRFHLLLLLSSFIKSCFVRSLNTSVEGNEATWLLLQWSKTPTHDPHAEGRAGESLFCPILVNRASASGKLTVSFPEPKFSKRTGRKLWMVSLPLGLDFFFYKVMTAVNVPGAELAF